MKKYVVLNFVVVFAVMLSACTSEMRNNLNELSSNSTEKVSNTKEQFLSETRDELNRLKVVLAEIENEAKKTSENLDDETQRKLIQIKEDRAKLERQVEILKTVSNDNWEMTKESFAESMDEFKAEFNKFVDGLKIG
ncbi:MAG: hypothetical protein JJ971_01385 [Balneolaceae bacterium]|nr:hypothetical protein [Balneolaceae bacterium]MBO6545024.1 hypothetical protein [Balneolaceae bacterium]MBO6646420.1 hypothetical protein [Balneolaceae bacterium]